MIVPEPPTGWHPALCAAHLRAPSLFVVAPDDEMPGADPDVARTAFERVPQPKELCEIEGGHFGLLHYPGELFDMASGVETRFLIRYLG